MTGGCGPPGVTAGRTLQDWATRSKVKGHCGNQLYSVPFAPQKKKTVHTALFRASSFFHSVIILFLHSVPLFSFPNTVHSHLQDHCTTEALPLMTNHPNLVA